MWGLAKGKLEDAYPRVQWIEITKARIRATIEARNIEEADQISDRLLRVQQSIFHHLCVDDNLRGHYSEMVVIAAASGPDKSTYKLS